MRCVFFDRFLRLRFFLFRYFCNSICHRSAQSYNNSKFKKKINEHDVRNIDFRLFRLKWKRKLIETLRRDWLKKVELIIFLLKRYLVNYHQTELTIEYHDKYLKLKTLISNENGFKDTSDWFSFKTFIELFKITIKNLEQYKCSRWSFKKLIINLINLKRKLFSKSKDDNRSNDQSKKTIIKLINKSWFSIIR